MVSSRIAELSSLIAAHTATIDEELARKDLPSPSFKPEQPLKIFADDGIARSRQIILEATDELHALMLGPAGILTTPAHNHQISLHAISHFGLATRLPSNSDKISFEEIAEGTPLSESTVRRILRHAMSNRIFCEPEKGYVAHTGASKYLAKNNDMRQWIEMVSEEMWPAATKTVQALEKWRGSDDPSHSGFNVAHNTDMISFDHLSQDPEREERYADAMRWFSTGAGLEMTHIINGFDWRSLGKATVVDVGGSHGALAVALCSAFPDLSCIVQDRAEVVSAGQARLPSEMKNRVSFMAHDFFDDQAVERAAVYVLRWILHDWSDTYAVKILMALIPALNEQTRILICELVLPQPGSVSSLRDRAVRGMDLAMLELHNGRERDLDEWTALLREADPRYHLINAHQPLRSRLSMLEVGWRGGT